MTKPEDERHTQAEGGRSLPQEGDAHQRPEAPRQSETRRKKEAHSEAEGRAEGNVSERDPSLRLFDLHCHLDFAENARELAAGLAQRGIGALSVTVTPAGYVRAAALFAPCANVHTALGLHPWWVADGRCGEADVARFERLAAKARFVGEVGLDFAPAHASTRETQLAAFERVARACADAERDGRAATPPPHSIPLPATPERDGRRVLSLHAVRAAGAVLDVLERTGAAQACTCVFHWFSGTAGELQRALGLGCLFSINPRMLATKRGRAYARALPPDRLLLETDLPAQGAGRADAADMESALQGALCELASLRGEDCGGLAERLARTGARILALPHAVPQPR